MPVNKLSNLAISSTSGKQYSSMLAGYGDFGALQRIAYSTGTGASSTISFQNIPQTFQDLQLVIYGRATDSATTDILAVQVNGLGLSVSSGRFLLGDGSTASSGSASDYYGVEIGRIPGNNATSGIHGIAVIHILNYRSSAFKTSLTRNACDLNGSGQTRLTVGLHRTTDAINRVDVFAYAGGNLSTTTTVALYGVRASAS